MKAIWRWLRKVLFGYTAEEAAAIQQKWIERIVDERIAAMFAALNDDDEEDDA